MISKDKYYELYEEGLKRAKEKGYDGDVAKGFARGYADGFSITYEEEMIKIKFLFPLLKNYDNQTIAKITDWGVEEIEEYRQLFL